MATKQKTAANEFLKRHNREWRPFAKALLPALQAQKRKMLQRFRDVTATRTVLEPTDAALLYPHGFSAAVMEIGNQQIIRGMRSGARSELSQVRRLAKRAPPTLPLEVQERISDAIDEQFGQRFWEDKFGDSTRKRIANVLFMAVNQGWPLQETVAFLRQDRFGIFNDVRAARIARTETTAALNGGAYISRQEALDDGAIIGEEWNTLVDGRERRTHRNADGQVTARDALGLWYVRDRQGNILADGREFVLGNERARYPGDPNLSSNNRVNCRCNSNAVV